MLGRGEALGGGDLGGCRRRGRCGRCSRALCARTRRGLVSIGARRCGARGLALGGDRPGPELWWAPERLFCSAEQRFAGGDEAPLSYGRPNFGAAPWVNCRIERATLLRVGRGQAVGLYAPLPASRRPAQNGRGHFDPSMAAVVSWVRDVPVLLLRRAEAFRFSSSMPFVPTRLGSAPTG